VAYSSDIDLVMSLLGEIARAQPRVLSEPPASVYIKNLGDNGIELELNTWIRDAEQGQGNLRSDLLLQAWKQFREEGIEVPFPQREVRVLQPVAQDAGPPSASAA
jgi:small-conductance mechanosensitive channel